MPDPWSVSGWYDDLIRKIRSFTDQFAQAPPEPPEPLPDYEPGYAAAGVQGYAPQPPEGGEEGAPFGTSPQPPPTPQYPTGTIGTGLLNMLGWGPEPVATPQPPQLNLPSFALPDISHLPVLGGLGGAFEEAGKQFMEPFTRPHGRAFLDYGQEAAGYLGEANRALTTAQKPEDVLPHAMFAAHHVGSAIGTMMRAPEEYPAIGWIPTLQNAILRGAEAFKGKVEEGYVQNVMAPIERAVTLGALQFETTPWMVNTAMRDTGKWLMYMTGQNQFLSKTDVDLFRSQDDLVRLRRTLDDPTRTRVDDYLTKVGYSDPVTQLAGARAVTKGMAPQEAAEKYQNPWLEMLTQAILDPLNFIDVPFRAAGALRPVKQVLREEAYAKNFEQTFKWRDLDETAQYWNRFGYQPGMDVPALLRYDPRTAQRQLLEKSGNIFRAVSEGAPNGDVLAARIEAFVLGETTDAKAAQMGGALQADTLQKLGQSENGMSARAFMRELLTDPETKQLDPNILAKLIGDKTTNEAMDTIAKHMEKSVDSFIRPAPQTGADRALRWAKGIEAARVIGANPGAIVRNVLNNTMTLAVDGLLTNEKLGNILDFMKDRGIPVSPIVEGRLGLVERRAADEAVRTWQEAFRASRGQNESALGWMGRALLGVKGNFVYGELEKNARLRAFYKGLVEAEMFYAPRAVDSVLAKFPHIETALGADGVKYLRSQLTDLSPNRASQFFADLRKQTGKELPVSVEHARSEAGQNGLYELKRMAPELAERVRGAYEKYAGDPAKLEAELTRLKGEASQSLARHAEREAELSRVEQAVSAPHPTEAQRLMPQTETKGMPQAVRASVRKDIDTGGQLALEARQLIERVANEAGHHGAVITNMQLDPIHYAVWNRYYKFADTVRDMARRDPRLWDTYFERARQYAREAAVTSQVRAEDMYRLYHGSDVGGPLEKTRPLVEKQFGGPLTADEVGRAREWWKKAGYDDPRVDVKGRPTTHAEEAAATAPQAAPRSAAEAVKQANERQAARQAEISASMQKRATETARSAEPRALTPAEQFWSLSDEAAKQNKFARMSEIASNPTTGWEEKAVQLRAELEKAAPAKVVAEARPLEAKAPKAETPVGVAQAEPVLATRPSVVSADELERQLAEAIKATKAHEFGGKAIATPEELAHATRQLYDAAAQTYSKLTGRPAAEYYGRFVAGVVKGGMGDLSQTAHLPEGVKLVSTYRLGDLERIGNAVHVEEGSLVASHVTSDPARVVSALSGGEKLDEIHGLGKVSDLGTSGLYFSDAPQLWTGRAAAKWEFLDKMTGEQKYKLIKKIENVLSLQRADGYISESEYILAVRQLNHFHSGELGKEAIVSLAGQPYNIAFWKSEFLKPLGIVQANEPGIVKVVLNGNFADVTHYRGELGELAKDLKAQGFDGMLHGGSMTELPQGVVWNPRAVFRFGAYQGEGTLFQQSAELRKAAHTITQDGRDLLHLFDGMAEGTLKSDVSSIAHETAHSFRRQMDILANDADVLKTAAGKRLREDLDYALRWSSEGHGVWDTAAEEKFAKGFEEYLRGGSTWHIPENIQRIYEQFRQWITQIYIAFTHDNRLPQLDEHMQRVFHNWLGGYPELNEQQAIGRIRQAASGKGIATTTEAGKPMDARLLSALNDHAGYAKDTPLTFTRDNLPYREKEAADILSRYVSTSHIPKPTRDFLRANEFTDEDLARMTPAAARDIEKNLRASLGEEKATVAYRKGVVQDTNEAMRREGQQLKAEEINRYFRPNPHGTNVVEGKSVWYNVNTGEWKPDKGIPPKGWKRVAGHEVDGWREMVSEKVTGGRDNWDQVVQAVIAQRRAQAETKAAYKPTPMFKAGEELPLTSGVAPRAKAEVFKPKEVPKQERMLETAPEFGQKKQPTFAQKAAQPVEALRGAELTLTDKLNVYEKVFEDYFKQNPNATEDLAHNFALFRSGLTEDGLRMSRIQAGKPNTARPGVLLSEVEAERYKEQKTKPTAAQSRFSNAKEARAFLDAIEASGAKTFSPSVQAEIAEAKRVITDSLKPKSAPTLFQTEPVPPAPSREELHAAFDEMVSAMRKGDAEATRQTNLKIEGLMKRIEANAMRLNGTLDADSFKAVLGKLERGEKVTLDGARRVTPDEFHFWAERLQRAVDAVHDDLKPQLGNTAKHTLTPALVDELQKGWANEATGLHLAAQDEAKARMNFALIGPERYNIEKLLDWIYPFHHWYSRTYMNWGRRLMENPRMAAGYLGFNRALEQINADLPDSYKHKIPIDLFGTRHYWDWETSLNPMRNLVDNFQVRERRPDVLGKAIDELGNWGPSPWWWLTWPYAFGKLAQGDKKTFQAWFNYITPVSRGLVRPVTALAREAGAPNIPPGGLYLEQYLLNFLGSHALDTGDMWEQRRTGKALYDLFNKGAVSPETGRPLNMTDILRASYYQKGPVWDMARQDAQVQAAGGALTSWLGLAGLKARPQALADIEKAQEEWHRLIGSKATDADYKAFFDKYPWFNVVRMASTDDAERNAMFFSDVLARIPPGQRQKTYAATGMADLITDYFKASRVRGKSEFLTQLQQEHPDVYKRFVGVMEQLDHTFNVPSKDVKDEWGAFKELSTQYYQLFQQNPTAARQFKADNPLLQKYLPDSDSERLWNAYYTLDPIGRSAARAAIKGLDVYVDKGTRELVGEKGLGGLASALELFSARLKETPSYQQYMQELNQRFGGDAIYALQSKYLAIPEDNKAARKAFREQNPQLAAFWQWRDGFLTLNPELKAALAGKGATPTQVPTKTPMQVKPTPGTVLPAVSGIPTQATMAVPVRAPTPVRAAPEGGQRPTQAPSTTHEQAIQRAAVALRPMAHELFAHIVNAQPLTAHGTNLLNAVHGAYAPYLPRPSFLQRVGAYIIPFYRQQQQQMLAQQRQRAGLRASRFIVPFSQR